MRNIIEMYERRKCTLHRHFSCDFVKRKSKTNEIQFVFFVVTDVVFNETPPCSKNKFSILLMKNCISFNSGTR